jgi:DNA-binding winged helix-turn-helix (wHTH) protein
MPQENEKPVLVVTEGPLRGQQWVMHRNELILGRGAHCDIVIPERSISREHVRVWKEGGECYVEDLNSKNGTHVNGDPLSEPRRLGEGDEIQVALTVKLKFVGSDATLPLTLDEGFSVRTGSLTLDPHTRQVMINDQVLEPELSLYQYRLLELLYERTGGVCSRDDVVAAVWPESAEEGVSEQAIDALVRRLRDRLAAVDPGHQYIVTVRGHGFRLDQPA